MGLHPEMAKRGAAVKAAYAHLSSTHPRWPEMSGAERFKAVHAHIDQPIQTLGSQVTALRGAGAFTPSTGKK